MRMERARWRDMTHTANTLTMRVRVSTSLKEEVQRTCACDTECVYRNRLDFKRTGEAVWCSTAQESLAARVTVSETVITRRSREEGSGSVDHFRWSLHKRTG